MKHDGPLNQGEVGPLSERPLVAQVVNVKFLQLRPLAPQDGLLFHFRFHAKLDEVPDC